MTHTDPAGRPYRRRAEDKRTATSRVATRAGLLLLVLVVLYYLVTSTLEVRALRMDLDRAQAQTLAAREQAGDEREALLLRLDALQADLDTARDEVAALREQLIEAGIAPVAGATDQALQDELDSRDAAAATEPQEAPGAPETASRVQTPAQAAPAAPAPAQPANPAPAAPAAPAPVAPVAPPASEPVVSVGGEHLLCILTICL